jgi:HD-like signal output (HDOD) protein
MNPNFDFKEAVAKIRNLNPSVGIFAQVRKLITSPDVPLDEVEDIIKLDTALTANIIRLSNSALRGGSIQIGSLKDAMTRVGLAEVNRFLSLSISKSVLYRRLEHYQISAYDYWSESVSTAILMELLSQRTKGDKSEAYTIGMLHGVGKLVINQVLGDLGMSVQMGAMIGVEKWEVKSIGFTYPAAGALLLKAWGLPQMICDTIEYQSAPELAPNPTPILNMLNFCLRFLPSTGVGFTVKEWSFPESDPFLEEFAISPEELKKMVEETAQKHGKAKASLSISS